MSLYMWFCRECKGHDFHILHSVDDVKCSDRVRIMCSGCGDEFYAAGHGIPMALVDIDKITDLEESLHLTEESILVYQRNGKNLEAKVDKLEKLLREQIEIKKDHTHEAQKSAGKRLEEEVNVVMNGELKELEKDVYKNAPREPEEGDGNG